MSDLSIEQLEASYGTSKVLFDLNFSVRSGAGLTLLGRNGAGKSTTFRSIMGLMKHAHGRVLLQGEDVTGLDAYRRARRGLGLVFEDRRVFPDLTVEENLEVGGSAVGDREPAPLDELYELFPRLGERSHQRAGLLSGGEMQALAIARAVRGRPKVLMLDEPSEGLAPLIVEKLIQDIRALRDRLGLTTLVAEHKQWFARECTEEVAILDTGRIVFLGTWAQFDEQAEELERHLTVG